MDTQIVILDSDHLRLHKQSHMPENCCGCLAGLFTLSLPLRLGGQLGKLFSESQAPGLLSFLGPGPGIFSLILSLHCPLRSADGRPETILEDDLRI